MTYELEMALAYGSYEDILAAADITAEEVDD